MRKAKRIDTSKYIEYAMQSSEIRFHSEIFSIYSFIAFYFSFHFQFLFLFHFFSFFRIVISDLQIYDSRLNIPDIATTITIIPTCLLEVSVFYALMGVHFNSFQYLQGELNSYPKSSSYKRFSKMPGKT